MTLARTAASGEYYHIFNRSTHHKTLFKDSNDWLRFLFLVLFSQSPISFGHISRFIQPEATNEGFSVPFERQNEIVANRFVGLTSFCLMPNHFHLLLRQVEDNGIARYMQRVMVAYTMYFNTKYGTVGHLFQGRYKAVHVSSNTQLLHLSAYIHLNSRELPRWKSREEQYPFSSLQDFIGVNRWGSVLETDIITGQFNVSASNYREFIKTSTAKSLHEHVPADSLAQSLAKTRVFANS